MVVSLRLSVGWSQGTSTKDVAGLSDVPIKAPFRMDYKGTSRNLYKFLVPAGEQTLRGRTVVQTLRHRAHTLATGLVRASLSHGQGAAHAMQPQVLTVLCNLSRPLQGAHTLPVLTQPCSGSHITLGHNQPFRIDSVSCPAP